jgi:hypothetical protein
MRNKKRILSVTVKRMIDADGDTSWMGEYSNQPKTEYAIDRQELGDQGRGEFRYFNGCVENYEGETPENIRKYIQQDYDRAESLNRGDWCFLGIQAEAEITICSQVKQTKTYVNYAETVQRIMSGGVWGVESDSDFEDVQKHELAELRDQLLALGFSRRAIATAYKNVQHKD